MLIEKLCSATPQLETSIDRQKNYLSQIGSGSSGVNIPHFGICKDLPWKKTSFSPEPLYQEIKSYTTTIATNGDPADIYYPIAKSNKCPVEFPIALLMQGATSSDPLFIVAQP